VAQRDPSLASVAKNNRDAANDLAIKAGRKSTLRLLESAAADLNRRLAGVGSTDPDDATFTVVQMEATRRQLVKVIKGLNGGLKGVLLDQADTAADLATSDMLDYLGRANAKFAGVSSGLALPEASMFDRVKTGVRSSVLNRIASYTPGDDESAGATGKPGILQRYGSNVIDHFEQTMAVGLLAQKPWAEMRADIVGQSPFLQQAPAFWAERLVRTETMGAYGRAAFESIRSADDELGDMCKILAATFDDRTGWDSYQVHGQIRLPDQAFEWMGGSYQNPPNRPKDREIVVPHRISWPIPDYLTWRTDGEVMARYREQRKKGSPGARPLMTTVPLDKFGKEGAEKSSG